MNISPLRQTGLTRGISLLEMLIGISLLALAVPLVLGSLVRAGEGGMVTRVESRCARIIPACLEEIYAAREGRQNLLTGSQRIADFPPDSEPVCLGFARRGGPVAKMDPEIYHAGLKQRGARGIHYLAAITVQTVAENDSTAKRRLKISVEYPATAPAGKRRKLDFYTGIP
jgi:hypothetical protein